MGHAIVTVGGVNGAETCRDARLPNNIVEQYFRQGAVVGGFPLLAVDFLRHPIMLSHVVHHTHTVDHFVRKVEIGFHKEDGAKFTNEGAAIHLLKHDRETTRPS